MTNLSRKLLIHTSGWLRAYVLTSLSRFFLTMNLLLPMPFTTHGTTITYTYFLFWWLCYFLAGFLSYIESKITSTIFLEIEKSFML